MNEMVRISHYQFAILIAHALEHAKLEEAAELMRAWLADYDRKESTRENGH